MDEERRPRRAGPVERPGAVGGKRDLNRRRRVQDLVEAGLSLFLARGIEAVTIDEVARHAGMAKGNFYRYFRDKADLVEAVVEPVAETARSAVDHCQRQLRTAVSKEDAAAAYAQLGSRLGHVLSAYPDALCLYLQERRAPATPARQAISDLATELDHRAIALSEAARDRGFLPVSDARVSALAVLGAVEALALASARQQIEGEPVATAKRFIAGVLDGLRDEGRASR